MSAETVLPGAAATAGAAVRGVRPAACLLVALDVVGHATFLRRVVAGRAAGRRHRPVAVVARPSGRPSSCRP